MNHVNCRIDNEPAEVYHSKREYISSSALPELRKSPLHFFEKWTNEVESTDAMERGTFIHKLLLEQDIEKYVARPQKEGRLVASNTKEYAAFLAANEGKTSIHPDLYNEAMKILTAACTNPRFVTAFEASDKEVSFYGTHKLTGLPIKARPDMIAKDGSFILDVKSTSDIMKFERQVFALAYDLRLIHYIETIRSVTGKNIPEIYFFAIEPKAPYASKTFRLTPSARATAENQWHAFLNEVSVCKAENHWPSFSDEIVELERPKYLEIESVSFDEVAV